MGSTAPRLKVLSVGSNAASAFLSWRLQASNACDVTVVWKQGHAHVAQYGISFKSQTFGNERFKPRQVVTSPDDAAAVRDAPYDYVFLSIKAMPEAYDMAAVIEKIVTPNHTCILVNTTQGLGLESALEERFPSNIVLSLVCGADLLQLGPSEFEHRGTTRLWVGPASKHPSMAAVQTDMAHALVLTLGSGGQMDCNVSPNIRQQQYEHVAGPTAFHPLSVIFETPNHQALIEKPGARQLIHAILDEIVGLAAAHDCKLPEDFKTRTIEDMTRPAMADSSMWQDYVARRPMEVETLLGSPIRLAKELNMSLPRLETIYPIMQNNNMMNQQRPRGDGPAAGGPGLPPSPHDNMPMSRNPINGNGMQMARTASNGMPNGMPNGPPNGMNRPPSQRPRGPSNAGPRRPMMNGAPSSFRPPNGAPINGYGSRQASRRGSVETADLEEFSHILAYGEDALDNSVYEMDRPDMGPRERSGQMGWDPRGPNPQRRPPGPGMGPGMGPMMNGSQQRMGPGPQARRPQPAPARPGPHVYDEDDDDFSSFDPAGGSGPPLIDPDNFDMMSVTSRKNRRAPAQSTAQGQFRKNVEIDNSLMSRSGRFMPNFGRRDRSSQQQQQLHSVAVLGDNILDDPMMSYSSNRYGTVDRGVMAESRTNSLTSQRLEELQYGPGPGGPGMGMGHYGVPRRSSQATGGFAPPLRVPIPGPGGKMSPAGGPMHSPNGYLNGGRPSPPDNGRQPLRSPNGNLGPSGCAVGSNGNSPLQSATISLTGSASASANSGDTHPSSSDQSAQSVQSAQSHGGRLVGGVR